MTSTVGADTFYADPAQLEAWLVKASAGASMTYATGASLDHRHPVAVLVRDWIDSGEVNPVKRRHPVSGELMHQVQRRGRLRGSESGESPAAPLRPAAALLPDDESPEGVIYRALLRASNLLLPCPTNAELARLAGLHDADAASYRLKRLRDLGLISIDTSGTTRNAARVVRITATGKRTAEG